MTLIVVNVIFWLAVLVLGVVVAMRSKALLWQGVTEARMDVLRILPRLFAGVVGSGFIAEMMPKALVLEWIGPESGFLGILISILAGAFTPGGPVVGFSIGAAALKSGAGMPQIVAYSTAWALYALHRVIVWETPLMPPRVVWLRAVASIPLPFIAAWLAIMIGKP